MEDADPENRELCPDGRCVGIMGADGHCGTCGAPRSGSRAAAERLPDPGPPRAAQAESAAEAFDPDARILCWDDRCVGILGPDGRCGTCGRSRG